MSKMSKSYLQVIAHYHAQPGNADQVCQLLAGLAEATRTEPKNLSYDYFRSPVDPDHFVILEQYSDASGLDAHRGMPHFQEIGIGKIIPLLARREVSSYMLGGDEG